SSLARYDACFFRSSTVTTALAFSVAAAGTLRAWGAGSAFVPRSSCRTRSRISARDRSDSCRIAASIFFRISAARSLESWADRGESRHAKSASDRNRRIEPPISGPPRLPPWGGGGGETRLGTRDSGLLKRHRLHHYTGRPRV